MSFQKMKFKEIINGDQKEFLINDKYVTEEVYNKILNDETLYTLPPLPKMNGSPENSCDAYQENEEICTCEECEELLTIISDIREMDDHEALEGLRNYLDALKTKIQLDTSTKIYNELGNSMIKVSARLENQLEDFVNQYYGEAE